MNKPLINILLRISRLDYLQRCLRSIRAQTYYPIAVHATIDRDRISSDDQQDFPFRSLTSVQKKDFPACSHHWNLYCNALISKVADGWFMFLDDDDQLAETTVIEKLVEYIKPGTEGLVFQMERWGERIPDKLRIRAGMVQRKHIGMPCILLPARHKNVAVFDGEKAADFRFIQAVSSKIRLDFIEHVVVSVDVKNEGAYDGQRSK